jgi:NAD-dependent deacetylase
VVWFGEMLDQDILDQAYRVLQECQTLLIIGTSGNVQPAASMGLYAKSHGAFVAEINLEATPYTGSYDLTVLGRAGAIIPGLLA